jgi:hypothetical protein
MLQMKGTEKFSDIVGRTAVPEVINGSCTERQINVPKIEGVTSLKTE